MTAALNIGEAATTSGVTAKMIRRYEAIGLLPPAQRSSSGYRVYGDQDVRVLQFIHRSRALGFPLAQIGDGRSDCPILDDLAAH